MKKSIFCFWLCLMSSAWANAQVSVGLELDSLEAAMGDLLQLQLWVKHAAQTKVFLPQTPVLSAELEVLETTRQDSLLPSGQRLTQQTWTLIAFDSGQYVIPPQAIPFQEGNQADTAYSTSLQFYIRGIPIDTTRFIAPIKDIIREPLSFREDVLPPLATAVGSVLVLALGYYLFRRRQHQVKERTVEKPKILLPPDVVAYEKLKQMETKDWLSKGEFKTYQTELTYILREYLQNRYQFSALESSTEEILNQIQTFELPTETLFLLKNTLQTADLVKFAKADLPIKQHEESLAAVRAFLKTTRPTEPTPPETQTNN